MNPHTPHPEDNQAASGIPAGPSGGNAVDGVDGGSTDAAGSTSQPTEPLPGGPVPEPPPLYPPRGAGRDSFPTPPPYEYGPMPAPGGTRPPGFFEWIRSLGVTRGRERWIGGVASGIAARLGVDPLIVRGVLIVLTIFAGVGLLLYGIAWSLLPEPDGRIHAQEALSGRWTAGMTGALVTTLIGLPGMGNGVWDWDRTGFGVAWTILWVGGAVYLIYYLSRRSQTRNGLTGAYPQPAGAAPAAQPTAVQPTAAQPATGPTAPVIGSGGPGGPAVAITAGAALLVGGGLSALDATNVIDLGAGRAAVAWAGAAAVLGLGILLSGVRGRTSGVLGFFAVVALVTGALFSVTPTGNRIQFTNTTWSPASIEQARTGLDIAAGSGTVDLTGLAGSRPLQSDVVIPLRATASELTITIPTSVPVRIDADITMGQLDDGNQSREGTSTYRRDYNTDRPGASLVLQITGTMSTISIKEGN